MTMFRYRGFGEQRNAELGITFHCSQNPGSLLTSIRTMFVGPIMGKFLDYSHRIYRYT